MIYSGIGIGDSPQKLCCRRERVTGTGSTQ